MKTEQINEMIEKAKAAVKDFEEVVLFFDSLKSEINEARKPVQQSVNADKYENELFVARFQPSYFERNQNAWTVETRSRKGIVGKKYFGKYATRQEAVKVADELAAQLVQIGVTQTPKRGRRSNSINTHTRHTQ